MTVGWCQHVLLYIEEQISHLNQIRLLFMEIIFFIFNLLKDARYIVWESSEVNIEDMVVELSYSEDGNKMMALAKQYR